MKFKKNIFMISFAIFLLLLVNGTKQAYAASNGEDISVKYQTQIQNIGWQNPVFDSQLSGTEKQSLRLEAIKVSVENPIPGMTVKYQTEVQTLGWLNWVDGDELSGTQGRSLRLEAIKIQLSGAPAGYHIQYRVQVQNIGWQDWVQDGDMAGTVGPGLRLEGIKIRIVKDNGAAMGGSGIKYQTHVQNIGWQDPVYDSQLSGTQKQCLRLEGINIWLQNQPSGMTLKYQTQVQNLGWQGWVQEGQTSGTVGSGLRLEAIQIALEGAPIGYHVQYQVQIQNIGWQGWMQDGATAGTVGPGLRLEGIRIRIVSDSNVISYTTLNMSLNDMLNKQMGNTPALQVNGEWRYAQIKNGQKGYYVVNNGLQVWKQSDADYENIKQQLLNNLDINILLSDPNKIYEFIKLSYVDGVTADQLNSVFKSTGVLAGKGQVFLDAAKESNVNPMYLAGHAILETGNGTSNLAKGISVNGVKYYNMFGIGAVDSNPDGAGSAYAAQNGWSDIDKAIKGGAQWISKGYINNANYKQDTLYKMKWNPSDITHQYATDVKWASNQVTIYKQCFDLFKDAKLYFEIPVYSN